MDSQCPFVAEELTCLVCHTVLKDPVLLSCSHNVCKVCFDQAWNCMASLYGVSACSASRCGLHREKFTLFCLNDEELLCEACRTSKTHENHKCCSVDIAARDYKKDFKITLRHLQNKCQVLKTVKSNYDQTAKCVKYQTKKTEQQIKEEFEKLHQFLQDEEASRLAALRQEEEQKSLRIKQKIEEMNVLMSYFSHILSTIMEEMESEEISFVQTLRAVEYGAQCSLQEPQMYSGALIDEAKHCGNLAFKVWEKMQETVQYRSVILDPNTAHPELTLSDDLTSVQRGHGTQNLPNNLERFDHIYCVVGSEAFTSGIHSWDTEVTDVPDWEVGVTTTLIPRARKTDLDSETWSVKASRSEYLARFSTSAAFQLHLKESIQRIRVRLDWDKGEVEFSDPVSDIHLFTFRHSFTGGVFPFFVTPCRHSALRILPLYPNFTLNTEKDRE